MVPAGVARDPSRPVELAMLLGAVVTAGLARLTDQNPILHATAAATCIGFAALTGPRYALGGEQAQDPSVLILTIALVALVYSSALSFPLAPSPLGSSILPLIDAALLMLLNTFIAASRQQASHRLVGVFVPLCVHASAPLWGIGHQDEALLMGAAVVTGSAFGHLLAHFVVRATSLADQRRLLVKLQPNDGAQIAAMDDAELERLIARMHLPREEVATAACAEMQSLHGSSQPSAPPLGSSPAQSAAVRLPSPGTGGTALTLTAHGASLDAGDSPATIAPAHTAVSSACDAARVLLVAQRGVAAESGGPNGLRVQSDATDAPPAHAALSPRAPSHSSARDGSASPAATSLPLAFHRSLDSSAFHRSLDSSSQSSCAAMSRSQRPPLMTAHPSPHMHRASPPPPLTQRAQQVDSPRAARHAARHTARSFLSRQTTAAASPFTAAASSPFSLSGNPSAASSSECHPTFPISRERGSCHQFRRRAFNESATQPVFSLAGSGFLPSPSP